MRYGVTLFLLSVFASSLALSQSTATKPAPKKTQAVSKTASSPKKTSASKKGVSSKTASNKGKTAKGKTAKKPVVAAYRQTVPTPERYKEIQQALVDKGYLKSEANGVWGNDSVEALKQFQTDQKQTPTGKLTSASLIALGLGPKTDGASLTQPPPSPVEPPPSITPAPVPAN